MSGKKRYQKGIEKSAEYLCHALLLRKRPAGLHLLCMSKSQGRGRNRVSVDG